MINVFNRKEVCITYDMAEQARVRDILKQNNIEYDLDTKRIESPLGGQSLIRLIHFPSGRSGQCQQRHEQSLSGTQSICQKI